MRPRPAIWTRITYTPGFEQFPHLRSHENRLQRQIDDLVEHQPNPFCLGQAGVNQQESLFAEPANTPPATLQISDTDLDSELLRNRFEFAVNCCIIHAVRTSEKRS